jgi:hypothetical protein
MRALCYFLNTHLYGVEKMKASKKITLVVLIMGCVQCLAFSAEPTTRKATKVELRSCLSSLRHSIGWKDRESIRVEGDTTVVQHGALKGSILLVPINAKNTYGAYVGAEIMYCRLNSKGKTLYSGSMKQLMEDNPPD